MCSFLFHTVPFVRWGVAIIGAFQLIERGCLTHPGTSAVECSQVPPSLPCICQRACCPALGRHSFELKFAPLLELMANASNEVWRQGRLPRSAHW